MVRAKNISKETQQSIMQEYGKIKAKDLAKKYGVTINQVYDVAKRKNLTEKQNKIIDINKEMNQILLGGLLGDGRFKKNGKQNTYYSECHALDEYDYLIWKHKHLGELTKDSTIYDKNTKYIEHNDAKEFTTKTTPSLNKYLNLNKLDVITDLEELGLLIHLLDDGWFSPDSNGNGRFCISVSSWSQEERDLLIKQWDRKMGIKFKSFGIKKINIGASCIYNDEIYKLALKYFNIDTDIIAKKFKIVIAKHNKL